jgi:hypothetical protein
MELFSSRHFSVLYKTWLQGLCRRNPQIDKHTIVFDNQSRILAFNQPLPNIDENVSKTLYIITPSSFNIILGGC